jgi:hypothetical protein
MFLLLSSNTWIVLSHPREHTWLQALPLQLLPGTSVSLISDLCSLSTATVLLTSLWAACRVRSCRHGPLYGPSADLLRDKPTPGAEGRRLPRDARRND